MDRTVPAPIKTEKCRTSSHRPVREPSGAWIPVYYSILNKIEPLQFIYKSVPDFSIFFGLSLVLIRESLVVADESKTQIAKKDPDLFNPWN